MTVNPHAIQARASQWRGSLLNICAVIERDIGFAIACYFGPDDAKQDLLYQKIIAELPALKKSNILWEILKHEDPLFNHVDGKEMLRSHIKEIFEFRNTIAHNTLSFDQMEYTDGGLSFVKHKGERETIHYTQDQFDELMIQARMVSTTITDITTLITGSHFGANRRLNQ